MRLSRWMILIAIFVSLGCLQVAQRTTMVLKGYAVGERMQRVHAQENAVAWLDAQVTGLGSPVRLAQAQEDRQLKLVAWSRLSPGLALVRVGPGPILPLVAPPAAPAEAGPTGRTAPEGRGPSGLHIGPHDQDTSD